MPSEVAFEQDGRILIGDDAAGASPTAIVARSVKRCLRCSPGQCRQRNSCWSRGAGEITVGGRTYKTEDVMRLIIDKACQIAQVPVSQDEITVRIGCPVQFERSRRQAILSAAVAVADRNDLGLNAVIPESGAAAVAVTQRENVKDGLALIVDFGGGSLDLALVSVMRRAGGLIAENIAYGGDDLLGGDDIDRAVCEWIEVELARERGLDLHTVRTEFTADHYAQRRLRLAARSAKEALSRQERTVILLTDIPPSLGAASWRPILDRDTLAELAQPLLGKMVNAFTRLFRAADHLPPDGKRAAEGRFDEQVQELRRIAEAYTVQVVLVGGTSQLLCVRETIGRIFGAEKIVEQRLLKPAEAVALGLAYEIDQELNDALRPPYSIYLHVRYPNGRVDPLCLYRAFTPVYDWSASFGAKSLRYAKQVTIEPGHISAELEIRDAADKPYKRIPLERQFRGQFIRLEIEPRTSLLTVHDGNPHPLLGLYLTRYGRDRDERAKREAAERERKQRELERERALNEGKRYRNMQ